MNPAALIEEVRRRGGELVPSKGGLRVRAAAPLPTELMAQLRAHKRELLQALGRWNPELAAEAYVWCLDCQHWGCDDPRGGPGCTHPDNPFHRQQPKAPRICRWYMAKQEAE